MKPGYTIDEIKGNLDASRAEIELEAQNIAHKIKSDPARLYAFLGLEYLPAKKVVKVYGCRSP